MSQIQHHRTTDCDGLPVVLVPLRKPFGAFATLDAADFDEWAASGRSFSWRLNDNGHNGYARLVYCDPNTVGKNRTVARGILGLGTGQRVGYHDRNPLNLRRSNLRVTEGFAKGETLVTDEFSPPSRQRPVATVSAAA